MRVILWPLIWDYIYWSWVHALTCENLFGLRAILAFWSFISSFLWVLWISSESWCLTRPHEQGHLETIEGEWSSTWPASLCECAQNTMDQCCVINVILNQTWARTMLHCWTVCPEEPVSPVHLGRSRSVTWWKTFPFNLWTIQLNWIGACPKTHVSEVNVHRI